MEISLKRSLRVNIFYDIHSCNVGGPVVHVKAGQLKAVRFVIILAQYKSQATSVYLLKLALKIFVYFQN